MNRLFVDTSAWDAIADKGDKNHGSALQYRDDIAGQYILLTSDYILDELYTLLLMNHHVKYSFHLSSFLI